MRRISPNLFSVVQIGGMLLAYLLFPLLGVYALSRMLPDGGGMGQWVLYTLLSGGLPVLYLFWFGGQLWSGLVMTPRHPWVLTVAEDSFTILTKRFCVTVPFAAVRSFTIVDDDSWDQLRGMEDMCLLVRLKSWLRISIPQSSAGFSDVVRAAHDRFVVTTIELAE